MKEYLLYLVIRLVSFVFNVLPLEFALRLGRIFGLLIYFTNKKRRSIAYANLKASFGDALSSIQKKHIVKGVYINLAQSFVEVMRFPRIDKDYVDRYIEIEKKDILDRAIESRRGVILLTAHFGNWELLALTGSLAGYRLHILAREQKLTRLNKLLNRYRQLGGSYIVPKGISVKALFSSLKENNPVGILADQDAGRNGIFVNFFGRLASTPRGAFELADKLGSVVLPVFIVRKDGPYHKIFIENPIDLEKNLDKELISQRGLQYFTNLLENYIRRYPSQWLWLHKRWKSSPNRRVLILDDGKKGHLNQSLAILKQLKKAHNDRFLGKGNFEVEIVRVDFKSKFRRFILNILVNLFSPFIQGNLKYLEFAFKKDSFLKFSNTFIDIIISCGSSLEAVSLALKKENNAKSIIIMKPSFVNVKKFDLAIVPLHDKPRLNPNILRVLLSPNLIDEEYLKKNSIKIINRLRFDKPFRIGLLLGGDSKRAYLSESLIRFIIQQLKEVSLKLDAGLLITTSRRTPPRIENLLKREMDNFSNCSLLIIANKDNPEEALGGILGLSDVIVISSDSISMISEAVSTGKPVIVFKTERRRTLGRYKEEILISELINKELVAFSEPSRLSDTIVTLASKKPMPREFNQMNEIYKCLLRRLL